jgi:hypothetical protein
VATAGDEIDDLYGLPLEDFTAARNELAKRLRAEGETDAAAEVAKLRKPSRPAGAINRAVRDRPELARAALDAAEQLADAQEAVVSGSGREALDEAARSEREAVEELVAAAAAELEAEGSAGPAMVDLVRKTLHAVAGDPQLQGELEAGRVVADREPVGFGAVAPRPAKRSGKTSGGSKSTPAKARKSAPAKRDDQRTAREREARAAEERASRKRLAEARRRVQQAKRQYEKRERDLDRGRDRLEEARRAVTAAEDEVAELAEDLQRRRKELEDAGAVLAELETEG